MAKKKSASAWRALNLATSIGITMAASVFIGYYIGHYLDKWILHDQNALGDVHLFPVRDCGRVPRCVPAHQSDLG